MNRFHACNSLPGASLDESLDRLLHDLRRLNRNLAPEGHALRYSKVFLSDIANQWTPFHASPLYREILSGTHCSVVGQAPLDGSKITVLAGSGAENNLLFHSFRLSGEEAAGLDSRAQTSLLFRRYIERIGAEGLTLEDDCLRTWIYVQDIDNNYAGVVRARNDLFKEHGLTPETHFIASTGIGGASPARGAVVSMDFLTLPGRKEIRHLHATDHLSPTHAYGVAFERGSRVTWKDGDLILISGTASIDARGQILHADDVLRQADRLLENIAALLAEGGAHLEDVRHFIVYLRDPADYLRIQEYMFFRFPHTPFVIVRAPVCRPGWLIEMECMAEPA